jgi:hypothetical protein
MIFGAKSRARLVVADLCPTNWLRLYNFIVDLFGHIPNRGTIAAAHKALLLIFTLSAASILNSLARSFKVKIPDKS